MQIIKLNEVFCFRFVYLELILQSFKIQKNLHLFKFIFINKNMWRKSGIAPIKNIMLMTKGTSRFRSSKKILLNVLNIEDSIKFKERIQPKTFCNTNRKKPIFDYINIMLAEDFLVNELKKMGVIEDELQHAQMIRGVPSRDHRNFVNIAGPSFQNELLSAQCIGCKVWEEGRYLFKHHKTLKDAEIKPDIMIREFHENVTEDLDKVQPILIAEYISEGNALDDLKVKFLLYEEIQVKYFIMVYKTKFVVFELNKKNLYVLKKDLEFVLHDNCKIGFPSKLSNLFNLKHIKTDTELTNWIGDLALTEKIIRRYDLFSLIDLYFHPFRIDKTP